VVNDLTLTAVPTGGFITTTDGSFAGLPVSVAASITQQQDVTATLTAVTPVKQVRPIIDALFSKQQQQQLSQPLSNFTQSMQFSKVTVAYGSVSSGTGAKAAATTPGAFALMATPSIDGAPQLKQMANALGLGVTDFALMSAGSGLNLGMVRPVQLQLPAPFTRTGSTLLAFNQDSAILEAMLSGSLAASIKLPGIAAAVPLQLTTDVSLRKPLVAAAVSSGGSEGVFLQLSSLVMRPIAFDKFSFVQFGDVRLSGAAVGGLSGLSKLALSAPVTVFGVEAPSSFVYDRWVGSGCNQHQLVVKLAKFHHRHDG
jgi:hypothetical protein